MGGASCVTALQSAAMAIATGTANNVLIPFGWNGYSQLSVSNRENPAARVPLRENAMSMAMYNYYAPFGVLSPMHFYAWLATRHRELYGTPDEAMGEVALACRAHAQHNPRAYMRDRPLTMEDYLSSEMMATPFRKFD